MVATSKVVETAQSDGSATEYFSADGLGSVRQLADSTGSVLLNQTFDPYGNPYVRSGAGDTRFGFTGEQVDGNGLVYLRARYYQPEMGRFLNADPSRQERNPYQYAMANPVLFADPSGEICLDPDAPNGFHLRPGEGCGYMEARQQAAAKHYATYEKDYLLWRRYPILYHANMINGHQTPSMVRAQIYAYEVLNLPLFSYDESAAYYQLAIPTALKAPFARFCSTEQVESYLAAGAAIAAATFQGADAANIDLGPSQAWNPYPEPSSGPGGVPKSDWVDPSQVYTPGGPSSNLFNTRPDGTGQALEPRGNTNPPTTDQGYARSTNPDIAPDTPPVAMGGQGRHVMGHRNYVPGRSTWKAGVDHIYWTQRAYQNGKHYPKYAGYIRWYDVGYPIGTAGETWIRVHYSGVGNSIHGYPHLYGPR